MGTSQANASAFGSISARGIQSFYSSNCWIEQPAVSQLHALLKFQGVSRICAFPDLHPGIHGPVGCAVLADRLYPSLIGSDIGCGMALFKTDLPLRKNKRDKLIKRLRTLEDQSVAHLLGDQTALRVDQLGSIGGGNHFCELQRLTSDVPELGLESDHAYLLVHSGSRALGAQIQSEFLEQETSVLDPDSSQGRSYLRDHDEAVEWATLNRRLIAERAALALKTSVTLVCDVPHNILSSDYGGWLHRKGVARVSNQGLVVPLAGSRSTPSYLLQAQGELETFLGSCSHGAGRKHKRSAMRKRKPNKDLTAFRMRENHVICDDKTLWLEESAEAYKNVNSVVGELEAHGIAKSIGVFEPLVTYKKVATQRPAEATWKRKLNRKEMHHG